MAISRNKSSSRVVETFVLNATQIADKEVFLAREPSQLVLHVPCGTSQIKGTDYNIDGNRLYWDGLALEVDLAENDTIIVDYN